MKKYYYMCGLTKERLKELGALHIIPATFSYSWGLMAGHSADVTESDHDYNFLEWAFTAEPEIAVWIALSARKPVEIRKKHFDTLVCGDWVSIVLGSEFHKRLCRVKGLHE